MAICVPNLNCKPPTAKALPSAFARLHETVRVSSAPARDASKDSRALWICPQCAARLVTRNMAHSCSTFMLAELFRASGTDVRELAERYVGLLRSLGDTQVIAQETRLVRVARVTFAAEHPRPVRRYKRASWWRLEVDVVARIGSGGGLRWLSTRNCKRLNGGLRADRRAADPCAEQQPRRRDQ